jgi:uncharacterized protein YjlB
MSDVISVTAKIIIKRRDVAGSWSDVVFHDFQHYDVMEAEVADLMWFL